MTALVSSDRRAPHILLCSAWQTVNIGDIAHTPGALALIDKYLPEADVTLVPHAPLTPDAEVLLRRRLPRLRIVSGIGGVSPDGTVTDSALAAAMDSADFLLHGSGPATLAWAQAEAFTRRTGRPFGV